MAQEGKAPGMPRSRVRHVLAKDRESLMARMGRDWEDLVEVRELLESNGEMWRSLLGEEPPEVSLRPVMEMAS